MTKKALLVGINDYAPAGAGGPDLRGCVNDVRDMANTLSVLGVVSPAPSTMRILTDTRATRASIISGFKWLTSGAKKGDMLVFHYSGHGSQVVDVSGDEIDRRDEAICPHDYACAGLSITRRRLDAQISVNVRGMGYSQVGQLEGTSDSLGEKVFT